MALYGGADLYEPSNENHTCGQCAILFPGPRKISITTQKRIIHQLLSVRSSEIEEAVSHCIIDLASSLDTRQLVKHWNCRKMRGITVCPSILEVAINIERKTSWFYLGEEDN